MVTRRTWRSIVGGWSITFIAATTCVAADSGRTKEIADSGRTKEIIAAGHQLFIKEFTVGAPGPNGGDGLGPLFNHVSCAACHRQGSLGGGGGAEFNVSLVSAQLEPNGSR